ncbi:MAG: hypothetical protein KDK36_13835 [Leptospiraceae bacterium]|nr:hypothetical protein [Leptospiraceae bacterium]
MTESEKTIEIIKSLQLQCDITGKINGLSFYKWKGNNVVRKIGKPSKPASPSQLECRRKFATLQNLSKIFKPIIQTTYNTGKKPLTPANLFIKRNGRIFEKRETNSVSWHLDKKSQLPLGFHSMSDLLNTDKIRSSSALPEIKETVHEQESPSRVYRDDNNPDYSKLKLTRSNYPIPFTPRLTKHSKDLFTLKWDDFTKRYDTIALTIFSPEKGIYHKTEININDNYHHIEIPEEFQNTKNYYYLYCYHSKRKTFSESITLTPEDDANMLWKIHQQKRALTQRTGIYTKNQGGKIHLSFSGRGLYCKTYQLDSNRVTKRKMLRFTNQLPFGCVLPTFDIPFYQLKQKNLSISEKDPVYHPLGNENKFENHLLLSLITSN